MNLKTSLQRTSLVASVVLGTALWQPAANAIEFTISSIPGSEIVFTPVGPGLAEISFLTSDPDGLSFQIDSVKDGTGSALGYLGGIVSLFEIGPVSVVSGPVPLIETAPVDGLGLFGIFDGVGGGLAFFGPPATASSIMTPGASAVGLAFGGVLPFDLDSTDPDLVDFFNGNEFSVTISFSATPGRTLADLIENGGRASFAGVLTSTSTTVPDSGTSLGLLGVGLLGLWAARRARKS